MAEAVGIDKDRPKEAVTVAVKMLKGKKIGGGWRFGGLGGGSEVVIFIKNVSFVASELNNCRGSGFT